MDFTLTDEQQMLADTARSLFSKECPASLVRAVADDPGAASALFDRHLRDWVALAGGPLVDLTLFMVEAGAAVAPGPYLATAGFFAPVLTAARHGLAEAAIAGEVTGTVRFAEGERVIDAHLVDHVALIGPGPSLSVVPAADLTLDPVETLDLARRSCAFPKTSGEHRPGIAGHNSPEVLGVDAAGLGDAVERATLAVAAESVGVARWLLETSVDYAKARVQFGKPIGSFQAVQHKLVGMALAYERAAAAVSYAAMCIDADDADRHRATHVAKAEAGIAARRCATDGLQVHGGVGYTYEHDLHLHLRRAVANDGLLGTPAWHHDRLAALLFDPRQ